MNTTVQTLCEAEEPRPVDALADLEKELKQEAEVSGDRRRGRRRVMKKRTLKDEEGYLGRLSILPPRS